MKLLLSLITMVFVGLQTHADTHTEPFTLKANSYSTYVNGSAHTKVLAIKGYLQTWAGHSICKGQGYNRVSPWNVTTELFEGERIYNVSADFICL